MFKSLIFLLSVGSFLLPANAAEQTSVFTRDNIKSISVVAPEWEGFTNADGSGLYWEVLKAVYEPVQVKVKTAIVPWNRAMKMVTKYRVYNAIVGENKNTEEELLFPDYAIDVEYMSVLSKASRNLPWDGTASLAGKKVGWIKDYDVIAKEDQTFELVQYRTTAQGLELLDAGKIDYMIDEWDEIAEAVSASGQDMTRYVMNEMPNGKDVYIAFANTPLSQMLIDIYNERIPVLYREKKLLNLYEKWEADIPLSVKDRANKAL